MRKLGKVILTLFIFLLVVAGIGLLVRYLVFLNDPDPYKTLLLPRFSAIELDLLDLKRDTAIMNARVMMNNPMPLAFTADSLDYEFFIEGVKVMESTYPEKFSLEKGDSAWVTFPVTVFNRKLVNILNGSEAKGLDSVTYSVNSTAYWGKRPFKLYIERVLPLFKIPDAKITGIKVDKLRLAEADLRVLVTFSNNNVFPIELIDIHYKFAFGDGPWVAGVKPGLTTIPEHSFNNLQFPLHIEFKGMGKTFFQLLKKGKNIPYRTVMEFRIHTEENMFRNCRVKMEGEGEVSEVLEVMDVEGK